MGKYILGILSKIHKNNLWRFCLFILLGVKDYHTMMLKDVKVNGHKLIPPRVTLHKNNISEVQKAVLRKKETQLLFLEVTVGSSIQLCMMGCRCFGKNLKAVSAAFLLVCF